MTRTIKNIIWDFDGTLFDTYPDIIRILKTILENSHGIFVDEGRIERLVKVEISHCAETVGRENGIDSASILEEFIKTYFSESEELPKPFPNVYGILNHFNEAGVNLLVTHRDRKSLFKILDAYNMTNIFREIIVMEDGYEPKPSPRSFNYLIDKYALDRSETMGIGDRDLDVMASVNSGITPCYFNEKGEKHPMAACNLSRYNELKTVLD